MAKRGTTIPRSAQLPMAIALIVVFAAVLFWRFAPRAERTVEAVSQSEETSIVSMIQVAELESLINSVEQGSSGRDADSSKWQPLKRDPFMREIAFSPGLPHYTAAGVLVAGEDGDIRRSRAIFRQEFLESAMLSSVFVIGNRSLVILNNQYLHLGDRINGFVVKRIFKDRIILEDSLGLESLRVGDPYREKLEGFAEEASS